MKTYKISFTTEVTESDIKGLKEDFEIEGSETGISWDDWLRQYFEESLYNNDYSFNFKIEKTEREV